MEEQERICCSVCSRPHHSTRLPFLCPVDARNACYIHRLDLATILLTNQDLSSQISALSTNPLGFSALDRLRSDTAIAAARAADTRAASKALRARIAAQREHIAVRRAVLQRRREDLASAGMGLAERRNHQVVETERRKKEGMDGWAKVTKEMERTRRFLCGEMARLFGPVAVRKAGSSRVVFEVGHVEVVDLMNMHNYTLEHISTSLGNIAQLLLRIAHYLNVRLPAELILPHKDYPRPTIFTLATSYRTSRSSLAIFPSDPTSPNSNSPDPLTPSRPRPLFLSKPLDALVKEDYPGYSAFIDGVALLCYNVGWLCISQGVIFPERITLEDVTSLGTNLYTLLYNDRPPAHPSSTKVPKAGPRPNRERSENRWSHGTAATFMSAANGADADRFLRFPTPSTISEKLKMKLLTDLAMPEWEVLDTREWQMEDVQEADAVLVSAMEKKEGKGEGSGAGSSNINASPWTKVRSLTRRR